MVLGINEKDIEYVDKADYTRAYGKYRIYITKKVKEGKAKVINKEKEYADPKWFKEYSFIKKDYGKREYAVNLAEAREYIRDIK